jgi:hypothetical protein
VLACERDNLVEERVTGAAVTSDQTSRSPRLPNVLVGLAMAALLLLATAGCDSIPNPLVSPSPQPSPTPSAEEVRLADAIRLRERLGLSTDERWVRTLSLDAEAIARGLGTSGYGFPLTDAELRTLEGRARNANAVTQTITAYAADHPDTWAGLYIDTTTGTVVARFTGDLALHRAAFARSLHAGARYEVAPATWTKAELDVLGDRVRAEEPWFATVGARLTGSGMNIVDNRAQVWVLSNRADIEQIVISHFDAAGRMTVETEGPLPWQGPRGDVIVVARDPAGDPVPNLDCALEPSDPNAEKGLLVSGDDGRCHFRRVAAIDTSVVLRGRVGQEVLVFGRGRITVRPGGTVELTIMVERPERPD